MNSKSAGLLFVIVAGAVIFALLWLSVPPYRGNTTTTTGTITIAVPTATATKAEATNNGCPAGSFSVAVQTVKGNELIDIFGKPYKFVRGLHFDAGLSYLVLTDKTGEIVKIVNETGNC